MGDWLIPQGFQMMRRRVTFRVEDSELDTWESFVEESDDVDTVSELIRTATDEYVSSVRTLDNN